MWICVYCGKPVPAGVAHPAVNVCCGEVGQVTEVDDVRVVCSRCGRYSREEESNFDAGRYICRRCADEELAEAEEFLQKAGGAK